MINQIWHFIQPEQIVTILVALSAFATVLTIAAPYLQGDRLRTRMKTVASERDRLKAAQRAALAVGEGRLREKPRTGLAAQLVEGLNLRHLMRAEGSRALLRQAGYRTERHLVTFIAIRAVTPLILGIIVFIYSSTIFADRVSPTMRLAATLIGMIGGFYLPIIFLKNMVQRRQESIRRAWSDALDLLLICVESGMSIEAAFKKVSAEIGSQSIPLAEELTLTTAELSYLPDRRQAYENLAKRTDIEGVKSVCVALQQAERYGTPLAQTLRVLAQENRDMRMSEAEKKAAALPPKLTVPMILFFLPVLFIVILGPAAIRVMALQ